MSLPHRPWLPRFSRRVRRALCVLVAGAMALAPVLSTAAQTHEAAHAAQGETHFHDAGHEDHGAGAADHHDDMADEGGLLHGLTHAAHACGHVVAIVASTVIAVPSTTDADALPDFRAAPADGPRTHPFRPPIV